MPDLPTLTLSQAHFDRVVSAFPGATNAEKAANYKNWLTNNLINYVRGVETLRISTQLEEERRGKFDTAVQEVEASLPGEVPFPIPSA